MPASDPSAISAGDLLQSAASRMAEWILSHLDDGIGPVPYEVHMAALEAQSAVEAWTEVRAHVPLPEVHASMARRMTARLEREETDAK